MQWRIQNFPQGGANPRGAPTCHSAKFCWKLRENWTRALGASKILPCRVSPYPPFPHPPPKTLLCLLPTAINSTSRTSLSYTFLPHHPHPRNPLCITFILKSSPTPPSSGGSRISQFSRRGRRGWGGSEDTTTGVWTKNLYTPHQDFCRKLHENERC